MLKMSRGVLGRSKGFSRYLGQGPAMQALLGSAALLVSGCGTNDTPAPSPTTKVGSAPVSARGALGTARAALVTNTVLTVSGDTFVRQGIPNGNEGADAELSVQNSSIHRTLLFFDTPGIRAAVGSGTVTSARMDLFISTNAGGWGSGRPISIHALRRASSENGATWNCGADANVQNQQPDCSGDTAWNMFANAAALPFVPEATATATITNGTQGVISFDVTQDVLAVLADTLPGHGWLIKKVDENATGSMRFVSREQGPAPRLTLTIDTPDSCTPTAIADTTCDGVDDDCDGDTDEDVPQVETTCGTGACASVGMETCVGGQLQDSCVVGTAAPSDVTCNLADDDCDGTVDEDFEPSVTTCGLGACAANGETQCVLGAVVDGCQAGEPASDDVSCDGIDDDCDGSADEAYESLATACGVGACQSTGNTGCVQGQVVDDCTPGAAAAGDTTCDGVDDDCDGSADEEFAPHCAAATAVTCVDGALSQGSCLDQNPCDGDESCTGAATCVPGTPPVLDDGNPCTIDACEPASGVTHALVSVGTVCGDYLACTSGGQCKSVLPPDPAEVAPALPVGRVSLIDRVRFMYEGEEPIQTDVAPGAISNRSVAILRGRVIDGSGGPLPQVTVSVHGHPEYGKTLSRIDGEYDLVVNGGGLLTLRFTRGGALEAQRRVRAPWQDYEALDDVALSVRDGAVTQVAFPSSAASVHSASVAQDVRGTRRARLYVPTGSGAMLRHADGTELAASSLSVRASELGVGTSGSIGLPALLPETASPLYTLELSADEAEAAQAVRVELTQGASVYVDNFLDLPVGTPLPVGTYDRTAATWVGGANGRVLRVLTTSSNLVEVDVDGSGTPATPQALDELGISVEELGAIAQLYAAGDAFLRLTVRQLAPIGVGLPFAASEGTGGVAPSLPGQLWPLNDVTLPTASVLDHVLSQSLPLAGTPFTLTYRSDRVVGDKRGQKLSIDATGPSVGGGVLGGLVDVRIAGQRHVFSVPPQAPGLVDFSWDGRDAAGRLLNGWQRANIRVGTVSAKSYREPEDTATAFAHTSATGVAIGEAGEPFVRWATHERLLYTFDSRQTDIGAWAIDEHHQYDPKSRVVYRGDGTAYATRTSSTIIDGVAGVAQVGSSGQHSGDGGLALAARMDSPRSLALGPDASLYIGTRRGVRRVSTDTSIITTVAGGSSKCNPNLIDGPAVDMCIFARTMDFAPDGSLIIADNPTTTGSVDRIRRLDLETGLIHHVAGVLPTSGCTNMGDGGPAHDAALCNLTAHASAPDGSIYLLDRGSTTNPLALRKISTDGIIDTIGTANWSTADDSAALAVGPDGSVYIAQPRSVSRILPTGTVTHFAGNLTSSGNSGDGGPAILARFGAGGPMSVAVGGDGRAFIGDSTNSRVRMVDQRGIIHRVAGTVPSSPTGNGGSPLDATLGTGLLRALPAPDGSMFVTALSNHTVRVVRPNITGDFLGEALVPSPDGGELYRFSADGRHLSTTLVPSGELVYSFGYDESLRLISVEDAAGFTTLIERDAQGNPTRIIAPSGEETLLDTNGNGYISAFIAPNGDESELTYDAGGLLTGLVDANGVEHDYDYDADGRLVTP
jgi:YD repeat-containing protein